MWNESNKGRIVKDWECERRENSKRFTLDFKHISCTFQQQKKSVVIFFFFLFINIDKFNICSVCLFSPYDPRVFWNDVIQYNEFIPNQCSLLNV